MKQPIIGILTWRQGLRFEEPGYLRRLIREGEELGAVVYLFSHHDVYQDKKRIRGFVPAGNGSWKAQIFPWPDVVIDRCRKGEEAYLNLRRQKGLFTYANSTYTNKWNATQLFSQSEELKKWIPKTVAYSPENLFRMLKEYPLLYIKPGNGTGGRSIIKIAQTSSGYQLHGRARNLLNKTAHFKTVSSLLAWINRWVDREKIRNGNFMIQQGLDLGLVPHRVADTRLLIQKDDSGEWKVTGLGVRVGPKNSPTSNLHGGGKPVPFKRLIAERFGEEKTKDIYQECIHLAHELVKLIERYFGSMMEFGLDIGIDVNGSVWLIEVNPKPGREIFKEMGQPLLYKQAVQRPLQYALFLAQRSNPPEMEQNAFALVRETSSEADKALENDPTWEEHAESPN